MKKFVCVGGYIRSRHDKQLHYVDAHNVMMLYRLNPFECVLVDGLDSGHLRSHRDEQPLIHLHPDPTGRYDLSDLLRRREELTLTPTLPDLSDELH